MSLSSVCERALTTVSIPSFSSMAASRMLPRVLCATCARDGGVRLEHAGVETADDLSAASELAQLIVLLLERPFVGGSDGEPLLA